MGFFIIKFKSNFAFSAGEIIRFQTENTFRNLLKSLIIVKQKKNPASR
jgi:hypothetical protein